MACGGALIRTRPKTSSQSAPAPWMYCELLRAQRRY
jgi:hypothetical protein